jgi:hypothetical protein
VVAQLAAVVCQPVECGRGGNVDPFTTANVAALLEDSLYRPVTGSPLARRLSKAAAIFFGRFARQAA